MGNLLLPKSGTLKLFHAYKKRSAKDYANSRGIRLLSISEKISAKIVLKKEDVQAKNKGTYIY